MQCHQTEYVLFTETTMETGIISSLTYWKSLNSRMKKWYKLLIAKGIGLKTA